MGIICEVEIESASVKLLSLSHSQHSDLRHRPDAQPNSPADGDIGFSSAKLCEVHVESDVSGHG